MRADNAEQECGIRWLAIQYAIPGYLPVPQKTKKCPAFVPDG